MLVHVHIDWQAAVLGELEQEIEEHERLIGVLRHPADGIGTRRNRRLQPIACGGEVARSIARQMRHDLQGNAVAPALAQLYHRFKRA
jgi:hypothetical protein